MNRTLSLMMIAFLASAQAALAKEYIHPKLKSKQTTIKTVVVLPPQVAAARNSTKGAESMVAESEAAARSLAVTIEGVLRKRGLEVVGGVLQASTAGLSRSDEARQTVATLQARYDSVAPQLVKHPKDVEKGRFSLGSDMSLPTGIDADALVFVRAQGAQTTKGAGFLQGGLIGMMASGTYIACDVVIVDASTGDVLFFSSTAKKGTLEAAGPALEEPLTKSFQKLPTGS